MSYIYCTEYKHGSKKCLYNLEVKHCLAFKKLADLKERMNDGDLTYRNGKIYQLVEVKL
jgi:hypothetical protein